MLRFIPDWKKCWRFASVQAASLLAVLSLLQLQALPLLEPLVPASKWPWVTAGFGLLIVAPPTRRTLGRRGLRT